MGRSFAVSSIAVLFARTAASQPAPTTEPQGEQPAPTTEPQGEQPQIHLVAEFPDSGPPRTHHYHEGFYFRGSVGGGYGWGSYDTSGRSELSASGGGLAADVWVGGSPSPGVAIGGGLISNWLPTAEFELAQGDVVTRSDGIANILIGPFIDGFPDVAGGWHFGAMVGFVSQPLAHPAFSNGIGFGGSGWVGHDVWVAPDWSVGGLLRFVAAQTYHSGRFDDRLSAGHFNVSLLVTALYH